MEEQRKKQMEEPSLAEKLREKEREEEREKKT